MDTRTSSETGIKRDTRMSPMNTDTVANNLDTVAGNVDARVAARANTRAAQRNHRIVVGAIVAVVAVAAIGAVITNANRHGVARTSTASSAAPAAASPDAIATPAGQAAPAGSADVNSAPANSPPVSDNTLPPPDGSAPAAGAAPPAADAASPSSGASRGTGYEAPVGDAAVITTAGNKLEPNGTMTAFGNGRLAASDSGTRAIPSAEQARASGADAVNADRQITSAVQSQIAADSTTQRSDLAVTTINGIVILTGTVPAPNVVDHVREVVEQVGAVRGVDATAVKVSAI